MKKLNIKIFFLSLLFLWFKNLTCDTLTIKVDTTCHNWKIVETPQEKTVHIDRSKLTVVHPRRFSVSTNSHFLKITIEEAEKVSLIIESNYGTFEIRENVLIELILHPAMQRLKYVHQYGVSHYAKKRNLYGGYDLDYNRFEHSIGVFFLVRMNGGLLVEQISALLHDVVQTAFSHVGDHLLGNGDTNKSGPAYHDKVFTEQLKKMGIEKILNKYGIQLQNIIPENLVIIKTGYPDICADRLEYTIHGGFLAGKLPLKKLKALLRQIGFENGTWYCTCINAARKIGYSSLYLTKKVSGAPWNPLIYELAARALSIALEMKILTEEDIMMGTDDWVWDKLKKSNNEKILELVNLILTVEQHYELAPPLQANKILDVKFRGIDPLVKTECGFVRLTELDEEFAREYYRVEKICKKGWPVLLSKCISKYF